MPNHKNKATYYKTRALCPDGIIRHTYSQLSPRSYENAMLKGYHAAYIKIGLLSVSGTVYLTDTPHPDDNGETYCKNIFDPHDDGVNADLLPRWDNLAEFLVKTEPDKQDIAAEVILGDDYGNESQ